MRLATLCSGDMGIYGPSVWNINVYATWNTNLYIACVHYPYMGLQAYKIINVIKVIKERLNK